jgi:uncharacterized integral membrane protein
VRDVRHTIKENMLQSKINNLISILTLNKAKLFRFAIFSFLITTFIGSLVMQKAYAQNADDLKLTAANTLSSTTSVDIKFNKIAGIKNYYLYHYKESDTDPFSNLHKISTSPITADSITTATYSQTVTETAGVWYYGLFAQKDAEIASDANAIKTTTQTPITTTDSSGGGGAGGAGGTAGDTTVVNPTQAEWDKNCSEAVASSKTSSGGISKGALTTVSLYSQMNSEGVKKVFKWSLSLVNVIVLMFLLIIAFANIARVQIDTYAVKSMFPTLIGGILLANFSWLLCRFLIETSTLLYNSLVGPYGGGAGLLSSIATGYGLGEQTICAAANGTSYASGLLGAIVGTVLIAIAAVLMFTLYALLIARIWIITMLVVIAPIACITLAVASTRPYFKKWSSLFFNWVFMTPAAFLILILAKQVTAIGDGPNLTRYILTTALLYFAIQVPFKMGGDWMRQWGNVVSSFKKKASQPIVNQGNAVKDWAGKGYQAQKDLLKLRAKELATRDTTFGGRVRNINPLSGARKMMARGRRNRETATETLDNRLKERDDTAAAQWGRNNDRGKARMEQLEKSRSGAKNAALEKTELAEGEGATRYYQDSKTNRSRTVGNELTQKAIEEELKQAKQTKAAALLKDDPTIKSLSQRLIKAGYESKTAEDIVANLESEHNKEFLNTNTGRIVYEKLTGAAWDKEAAEEWLKKAQNKIASHYAGRNEESAPDSEGARKARNLSKARVESTIADLQVKRAFIRAESKAREDYVSAVARGKVEDATPEEVESAKNLLEQRSKLLLLRGERDAMHKQVDGLKGDAKKEIEPIVDEIKALEAKRNEEIAELTKKAIAKVETSGITDPYTISKKVRALKISEEYDAKGLAEINAKKTRVKEIEEQFSQRDDVKAIKTKITTKSNEIKMATIKLDKLDQQVVRHSYEAQEAAITADDELVETSARRVAMLSQSEVGHAIDARRALYRQHIATYQAMADQYAQMAIAKLRIDPAWIAKYTSTDFETGVAQDPNAGYGEAQVYARNADDVIDMRDKHYITQIKLATAKANAESEHRKGVEKSTLEMIGSQMINDRIEIADATVKKTTARVKKLTEELEKRRNEMKTLEVQTIAASESGFIPPELEEQFNNSKKAVEEAEKELIPAKHSLAFAEENYDNQQAQLEEHAKLVFDQTGGNLELLGEHQRPYYAEIKDTSGNVIGFRVRHARTDPDLAELKQRKEIDRGIGEVKSALQSGISGYTESFSPDAILNELRGEGIDIHNNSKQHGGEAVKELLRGNIQHGLSMIQNDARDWRKIVSCIGAALNLMQRTTSGGNNTIRVACIDEIFPDELIKQILYSVADFPAFKALASTGKGNSTTGDAATVRKILDIAQSNNPPNIPEVRKLLNSFVVDAPQRHLANVIKDQPIFGRLVSLLSSGAG